MTDDTYDISIRLCDGEGMVSEEPVREAGETLDPSYLARANRLAGPTLPSGDKRPGWPWTEGWGCTGHAHWMGLHIGCTSPAHNPLIARGEEG